ncbi:MAG: PEPxxWA-CTERM sorting domain-containing protein [Novosphingobium sp.]|nr:PEPxxWA-CTERM sorting domain-containing protein [Novosphingobium sp.]
MNVGGANGLSSLSGNHNIPLVGVFTTATDPFGGAAPAPLSFDGNNPTGLSPLLNQVFYIGDGKAGYNNAAGALLQFIAPLTATRLYLGTIDASGFNNPTGFYADNHGSFSVTVDLAAVNGAVPELGTWAMMLVGFGAIGTLMRRRRQIKPAHA